MKDRSSLPRSASAILAVFVIGQAVEAKGEPGQPTPDVSLTELSRGQNVDDVNGGRLGDIYQASASAATIMLDSGSKIQVPLNAFREGEDSVILAASAADIYGTLSLAEAYQAQSAPRAAALATRPVIGQLPPPAPPSAESLDRNGTRATE